MPDSESQTTAPLGEPTIFVEVLRPIGDGNSFARSRKQISIQTWQRAHEPGDLVATEINRALEELGWKTAP